MAGEVAELRDLMQPVAVASTVTRLWDQWNSQRREKLDEWNEVRAFVFATDTTKTSNKHLPWRNTTTVPKLTQIRDNLHANYMAALFPNDDWLRWEGYSLEDETAAKKEAIQAYMSNKLREANFRTLVSKLLYDYIDYGNAIADDKFIAESKEDETGELVPGYVGPVAVRVSPNDIVFNPTASTFRNSPKITRSVVHMGELLKRSKTWADQEHVTDNLQRIKDIRTKAASFKVEDFDKAAQYSIDGFGDLQEYYQSDYVEILEIEGDLYDSETETLLEDHIITVVDRNTVLRKEPMPQWRPGGSKNHVGWRLRQDNLWAMGPLDNLVGMQYRIDHLENLKADAWDMLAFPMVKVIGEVEEFNFGPGEEIHIDEGGDVQFLAPEALFLQTDTQIAILEQKMEEFAGSPKEAMGIRSPGEKTAFEVQQLATAASRIFQEKITNFEVNLLEPLLNSMLESARRNIDTADIVRVMDTDLGVINFLTITKEDITAKGKLRPIGARHFAAQSKMLQDLAQLSSSGLGQVVAPHMSGKALSRFVEDILQLQRFELFSDNAALIEGMETQQLAQQAQSQLETQEAVGQGEELEAIS